MAILGQTSRPGGSPGAQTPIRPITHVADCTTGGCHADVVSRRFLHGPVGQRSCEPCHLDLEPRDHTFRFPDDREKLCYRCHAVEMRDVIHDPVAKGDCTACHDPHGSSRKMMLKLDPATELCQSCHEDRGYREKRFVHGPVAVGACIVCHEPHSSWHASLLVKQPSEVCNACHGAVRTALGTKRYMHPPVAEGLCLRCHDPHASDVAGQLRGPAASLCVDCHEPIKTALETMAVVHGAATEVDGCVNCHVGHASDRPKLQRDAQPEACLTCHNQQLTDKSGRPIENIDSLLRDNPNHHGPIREGHCTACHDPHASPRFRLLMTEYPEDFYAEFDLERYQLCFTCHRPEMVTSKSGRGVTNFRDGDENLHHLHVNRKKGRTCRACHEVHASKNPFHIRDAVPFGADNWMLEIKFRRLDNGGSCAPACHAEKAYDRQDRLRVNSTQPTGASP